ncbi:hypothetical protein [Pinibacter aurantiacus]|uniref:Uncharacterized protein n=1 Tax=Pinibacter aurantiacus TaxID=2851599 RepID=A0A9E2SAP2_9BACT|nr:hypothetical protein [Pinibacter aurantiacus]MBV4359066.1 hypothetical protein [Pinibacter aurantiacus]
MKKSLAFKYDDNYYSAEYEEHNGYYLIENIRIDFNDGIADIPVRSMKLHCRICNDTLMWLDEEGNTNLLIGSLGNAIRFIEKGF